MTTLAIAVWMSVAGVAGADGGVADADAGVDAGMEITVAEKFPTVGRETTITLSQSVDQLAITYQPDAPVARTVHLSTDGELEVPWTPEKPGIVKIVAVGTGAKAEDDAKAEVSVKFDGTPTLGVAIFILAGIILFGGAAACMYSIFAARAEEKD